MSLLSGDEALPLWTVPIEIVVVFLGIAAIVMIVRRPRFVADVRTAGKRSFGFTVRPHDITEVRIR
jgi:hypothetical protein